MPLTIQPHREVTTFDRGAPPRRGPADQISIVLVNNMPDSALESTAAQFSRLLRTAAGPLPIQLRFCHLPEVQRGPEALEHVSRAYWPIAEILDTQVDALIVTGMEPKARQLQDEPCWCRFQQLVAWAEAHSISSIWSCLAAHAAVQILDGIERRRLEEKRFGVFEHSILSAHPLMNGVRAPLATPHSRWNELPVSQLRDAGYTIVSSSPETGADLFVKHSGSLLVFFQGHPEYDGSTLLREYRRDVGRFLKGQQPQYPTLPRGYFSRDATARLMEFRERALAAPSTDLLGSFPLDAGACVPNAWDAAAVRIYRNWLSLIAATRNSGTAIASAGS